MNNLFKQVSSNWVKYSEYEFRDNGEFLYITPTPNAKPIIYNPLKNADEMVVDALNVSLQLTRNIKADVAKSVVLEFVSKYGLLGFMTALPSTPHFADYTSAEPDYDDVYLPKNHFVKAKSVDVDEYIDLFFPFEKVDYIKTYDSVRLNIGPDRDMMALALTFEDKPMALQMSFLRNYAENYDWLTTQFRDWAFVFLTSFIYYQDYDKEDKETLQLYREGMKAFGGIMPTYRIGLFDKPTIIWDFYSLLLCIQIMFSFALTDENNLLKWCRNCYMAFMAESSDVDLCSKRCVKQYKANKQKE